MNCNKLIKFIARCKITVDKIKASDKWYRKVIILQKGYTRKGTDVALATVVDIEALPEGTRAELIDGKIVYNVEPNLTVHQELVGFMSVMLGSYAASKGRRGDVIIGPIDVQLFGFDIYNVVQPDVIVVCDHSKLDNGRRCIGAPDLIVEVVAQETKERDYVIKPYKFFTAGVKEYWVIDPQKRKIIVYKFETHDYDVYSFEDTIRVGIYPELKIDFSQLDLIE